MRATLSDVDVALGAQERLPGVKLEAPIDALKDGSILEDLEQRTPTSTQKRSHVTILTVWARERVTSTRLERA